MKCYDGNGEEKECTNLGVGTPVCHKTVAGSVTTKGCMILPSGGAVGCTNPDGGALCFCDTDLCNSSDSIRQGMASMLVAVTVTCLLAKKLFI